MSSVTQEINNEKLSQDAPKPTPLAWAGESLGFCKNLFGSIIEVRLETFRNRCLNPQGECTQFD